MLLHPKSISKDLPLLCQVLLTNSSAHVHNSGFDSVKLHVFFSAGFGEESVPKELNWDGII